MKKRVWLFKHLINLQFLLVSIFFISEVNFVFSQDSPVLPYQMPPPEIAELVDAPPTPSVNIDPNHQWLLIQEQPNLVALNELAQPEERLAGIRFNPKSYGPSRSGYFTGLRLININHKKEFAIDGLPETGKFRSIRWSPDSKYIAFINSKETGQDLWIIDVQKKSAKTLLTDKINSIYGSAFVWHPESKHLICKILPEDLGEAPVKPSVPEGPVIQETTEKKAAARTYQDLLKNFYDEKLFEYYTTVQILLISVDGEEQQIGKSGIIRRMECSPDGQYLLIETVHRPFSYLVPVYRFPYKVEIWDQNGNIIKQIADLPLAEEVPIGFGAVPVGPRSFDWRSDMPATLYWVEAQDGGDPKIETEIRDKIFFSEAPFIETPESLISLQLRYDSILWGHKNLALVYEWWWQNRQIRAWRINPETQIINTIPVFDFSWQDRYNDPGSPLMRQLSTGYSVLLTDKSSNHLFLVGEGASAEGDRPFIDRFNISNRTKIRLWRSEAPYFERPVGFIDINNLTLLSQRESIGEPPNIYIRNLKNKSISQLTHFPHPIPQLKDVQKELIRYEREDGVKLTAILYLPPGYKIENGPLPMLMWAYPQEFKSADAAGQVTDSPYRFVRVSWGSPLLWLNYGYAVLDDPSMPIIGEGEIESNDTYVEQLVASARAAVEVVVRRGAANKNKIAIGGHSYGAFMTANLLAHSDLFAAGIARSGAYNRTLTPFGFQAEERTFWEAPEIYFRMSPFMHADQVNEPILLIHGEADNNAGTFPLQSERFYNAVKGLGGTARLVMLPYESHGYRARESVMHMLWEMTNWLEKYVKNGKGKK
jgi:dipeptidyl aminopeptidase/acylaminoacyl peptidase